MNAKVLVLPVALGLIATASHDTRLGPHSVRGVVDARARWCLESAGDGYTETVTIGGVQRRIRQWQGSRGETMELAFETGLQPGTRVNRGQELGRFIFPMERYRYDCAVAQLEEARARLRRLDAGAREEELRIARSRLSMAELEEARLATTEARASSLHVRDLISTERYESDKSELLIAREETRAAREELALLEAGATREEREVFAAELRIREAEVAEARVRAEDTVLVSPLNGIVTDGPQGYLLAVEERDTVLVRIPVDQESAAEISRGSIGTIRGPGEVRGTGVITGLGQTAQVIGDRVSVVVTLSVPNLDHGLKPGMTVEARLGEEGHS